MAFDARDMRDIIQIDSEINKIQDSDLLLERILLEARRVVNAEAGTIYVKDGEKLNFKYSQNALKERELPPGTKLPYSSFSLLINEKTISGYVAKTGELLNIPDVYEIPKGSPYGYSSYFDEQTHYKTTSMLTLPLKTSGGGLLGVIQVINAKDGEGKTRAFSKEDEILVTHFAANATVALQRAFMTKAMILRMIKMAELRDPKETGAHVNRVAGYAVEIYDRWAFKRGVPEKERDRAKDMLKLAAMLHDVGKVAISDLILKKPARFTPEEYKVMQGHTYFGSLLFIDSDSELDRVAADIASTHHENWDGTGYPSTITEWPDDIIKGISDRSPKNLAGEAIPLGGRIVAVADVFDALISKRVYKEPWDEEQVYAEIRKLAGSKFDPEVVEAFFEVRANIEAIRARYPDAEAKPEAEA
ncbi:MAG: HD domain-containing protein [Spirochaetaceae bacterium]|nr:HD domain-containing protein [Spirochaetaceae bacterium]